MKNIEHKTIKLENDETYTYRYCPGESKTLILLHGNLASSLFFEQLILDLPKDYTIYALDLRGFGNSTYNRPIDTLRDFAGDLKLFVDKLGLRKFDLLGWSTGGAVAMLFTIYYGYMIDNLYLLATASISGYHSYQVNDKTDKVLLKTKAEIASDKQKIEILRAIKNKDRVFYKKMWDQAIYNINKPSAEVYKKQIDESLLQKNLIDVYHGLNRFNISDYYNGLSMGSEEVRLISQNAVIIHGDSDLLVSVDEALELKNAIGDNAKLHILENCGHSPMVDAPKKLVEIITSKY